jgi:transposase
MKTTPRLPLSNGRVHVRPEDVTDINGHVWFTDNDGYRVVYQGVDTPLYRVALNDNVQVRYVAVSLRLGGLVRQEEIARAFGHSVMSQRRWERRYEVEGLEGLRRKKARGATIKIAPTQEAYIRKWYEGGEKKAEIARRLGVSEGTVRNALKRMGLHRDTDKTAALPLPEPEEEAQEETAPTEPSEASRPDDEEQVPADDEGSVEVPGPAPSSFLDPLNRIVDRMLARLGHLDDADPVFANVEGLPRAGIFLAIPLVVQSGMLPIFSRLYGSIGPAFYGLRTTVVCLFMLALLRIKRPENLKEYDPQDLGRLLGLDRAPEVKTLRRKLDALAQRDKGLELMRTLAARRSRDRDEAIGVLYVDGHVKEYHGKKKVGKGYITQRRLSVPAVTDTWVNDVEGDPLFVVTSQMNAGLTKTLEPVLAEVRKLVGDTIVFDRGGWSTKLFYKIINAGFDIITYRKGHDPQIPLDAFQKFTHEEKGQKYEYKLHDKPRVRVGKTSIKKNEKGSKYVWMRQVTRLRKDHHQTPVITTREDLPPEKVLYLMFNRWRQENFFKYMLEEFALDALLEYGDEPVVEQEDRPNPEVRKIDKHLRKVRADLAKTERLLGIELRDNEEAKRPTVRGFKIAHAKLLKKVGKIRHKIAQLEARKARLPKRVPVSDLVSLKKERKLISDAIKMTAYQIESDMTRLVAESYKRNTDEGRTLLHAMFQSRGDIEVKDGELRVTLAPQSSPHRTRAIQALCEKLTRLGTKFPGTNLRLALTVAEPVKIA